MLHGAEERLKKFRYFTFEPSIDTDEAVLADFVRRAADLAILPRSARLALVIEGGRGDDRVPDDWEPIG